MVRTLQLREPARGHDQHIDGGNRVLVIMEKRLPALFRSAAAGDHIFGDGRLRDTIAQHAQLAMDVRRAPQRVFAAHATDECDQLRIDLRSAAFAATEHSPPDANVIAIEMDEPIRLQRKPIAQYAAADKTTPAEKEIPTHTR